MIALVGQVVHANGIVFDGYISKTIPLAWTICPTNAIIQIRPCLRSTARRRSKDSGSVSSQPSGSKTPSGSVTPSSSSFTMLRLVLTRGIDEGVKAAAEPRRREAIANFIFKLVIE